MERLKFVRFASRLGIPFIDIDMDKEEVGEDYKHTHKAVKKGLFDEMLKHGSRISKAVYTGALVLVRENQNANDN